MFYHLEGIVSEIAPESAVIDCGGIGFNVLITPNTAARLLKGEKNKLYISESVGEDHFDLYGFMSQNERKYYELLITVSGVGPKAALSILSCNGPDAISSAIASGNETAFTVCPGIGKKTAQRIILELKDKIAKISDISFEPVQNLSAVGGVNNSFNEAVSALSVLGYSNSDVIPILKQIDVEGKSTSEIIKEVLKFMV